MDSPLRPTPPPAGQGSFNELLQEAGDSGQDYGSLEREWVRLDEAKTAFQDEKDALEARRNLLDAQREKVAFDREQLEEDRASIKKLREEFELEKAAFDELKKVKEVVVELTDQQLKLCSTIADGSGLYETVERLHMSLSKEKDASREKDIAVAKLQTERDLLDKRNTRLEEELAESRKELGKCWQQAQEQAAKASSEHLGALERLLVKSAVPMKRSADNVALNEPQAKRRAVGEGGSSSGGIGGNDGDADSHTV